MTTCFKCGKLIPGKTCPGEYVMCHECADDFKRFRNGWLKETDILGLKEAVKRRLDDIEELVRYMDYSKHRYIQERFCEILELVDTYGKDKQDD